MLCPLRAGRILRLASGIPNAHIDVKWDAEDKPVLKPVPASAIQQHKGVLVRERSRDRGVPDPRDFKRTRA
jgi:hypothetical protein